MFTFRTDSIKLANSSRSLYDRKCEPRLQLAIYSFQRDSGTFARQKEALESSNETFELGTMFWVAFQSI